MHAEPSALPESAGRRSRAVPEHSTTREMCAAGRNEAICSESEQKTQTNRVGKQQNWHRESRRWLQHRAGVEVLDVRPPTRIAGREELQVVAQIASSSYEGALRASGTDGVMIRLFHTTEEEKTPSAPCFYLWY